MIRLSDKGKFRLRKLFSFPSLLYFLLVFFCSCASYFSFYWSNSAAQDQVAAKFAAAAEESETKSLNVLITSNEIKSRADYINFFQLGFDLYHSNPNRDKFSAYSLYSPGNNLFGLNYVYTCSEIFPDIEELSVFSSPFNSPVTSDEGVLKHEIWGIKLLLSNTVTNSTNGIQSTNFFYIPVSSADRILKKRGVDSPSLDDYSTLLGQTVEVNFVDKNTGQVQTMNWCIANIYEEDEQYDFYVSRFGYPLFCYLGLPSFIYPSLSIDFGHSQYMCKTYLSNLFEDKYVPQATASYSVSPGIDGKTSINSQNISSILTDFSSGYSTFLCTIAYIIVIALFSLLTYVHVSSNYFYSLEIVFVSSVSYFLAVFLLFCFCWFFGSVIPFYSSISATVSTLWLLTLSNLALSYKRIKNPPFRRLENDKLHL